MDEKYYHFYRHKQTGKQVKAVRFRRGLEDGVIDNKPYIVAIPVRGYGVKEKVFVTNIDFIVLAECKSNVDDTIKEFKLIFNENAFLSMYSRI